MLSLRQAILRQQRLAGETYYPPYSLSALNQRFQPGQHCLKSLLLKMYSSSGGWEMLNNDTVKLSKIITSAGWHAFGATIEVILHRSGEVNFNCRIKNGSWFDPYDFNIKVLVATISGKMIFLQRSGHIGPSSVNIIKENLHSPVVGAYFDEFINSWMDTNTDYSDSATNLLENCLTLLTPWVLGMAFFPAQTIGLVNFLGGEFAFSMMTGSSFEESYRMISGILWIMGPYKTFYVIPAAGKAILGTATRRLHQEEYDWANNIIFNKTLPPIESILLTDSIGSDDQAFVFPMYGNMITLNMGPLAFYDPRKYKIGKVNNATGRAYKYGEVFVHELMHAWQIHHSTFDQLFLAGTFSTLICQAGLSRYEYPPTLPFKDYDMEEQAALVSDWYNIYVDSEAGVPDPKSDPRYKYILHIQSV